MKVGFIGLGHMGAGMAANLLKAGHDVTVYNRTRTKVEALVAQGAKAAASVSDACSGDAVITMLANDDAVESVVFSDGSIIGSLHAAAIHISSSTISVALSERLEAAHANAGQRVLEAPVFKPYGGLIADGQFEPAGFAAPLGYKDIRLTLAAADDLRVPLPLASFLRDRFLTLLAHGGDKLDWSAIGRLAAKDAGTVEGAC